MLASSGNSRSSVELVYRLVDQLIVGVQARSFGRWVAGVQARQLSDSGSSTVRASGGDSG